MRLSVMILAASLAVAFVVPADAGEALKALAYCRGAAAKALALSSSEPAATVAQAAIGHCLDKEPAAREEIVRSSGTFGPSEAQQMLDQMKRDPSVLLSIILEARSHRNSARQR